MYRQSGRRMKYARGPWRRAGSLFSCLCIALLCSICMTTCSPHIPPRPLPDLQMPGVSKVPGFESFSKSATNGYPPQALGRLTAYQPEGPGQPGRALLPLGGNLYDIGLDGKAPRIVPIANTCSDRPSISPDGRWLLCSNTEGVITLDLQWPSPGNVQIALADQTRPELATFSPDGRRFIVTQFADKDCELGVYASEPPHRDSRPVTELLFPDLVEVGKTWAGGFAHACVISDVGWSPDGNWIAFIAGRPNADVTSRLYALNLSAIALPSSTATDPTRIITIPSSAVNDLGAGHDFGVVGTNLTWPHAFDTVSMPAGNEIININLRTNERRVVLSVEDAQFCAASWTPDGVQLFFALCRPYPSNPDTSAPPAQLYLYTP